MGVFEMVVIIVALGMIGESVKFVIKSRVAQSASMSNGQFQTLCDRLDKLERRQANLETIVLEAEKHKEFDRSL